MLNTRQTRKLVRGMLALKKCYIWGTWTEQVVRNKQVDNTLRNICVIFALLQQENA